MSEEQFAELGAIEARHAFKYFLLYNTWRGLKLKRLMCILIVQGLYSVLFQGNLPLVIWSLCDVTIKQEVPRGHLPRE